MEAAVGGAPASDVVNESYSIRAARPDDVDGLPAVELQATRLYREYMDEIGITEEGFAHVTSVDEFRVAQEQGHLWVAADGGDEPVGFALVREIDGVAHLEELDVDTAHGRQGLGKRLLHTVCRWAEAVGYPAVTLSTFRDIPWNAPFYARHGFRSLDPSELGEGLRRLVEGERKRGLRIDLRVIMRWDAEGGGDGGVAC